MSAPECSTISIASDELRVTVNPKVGGTITAIIHLGLGLSVLGEVPWDPVDAPIGGFAARDEMHWLSRYTGGWPLLFPNGGDACTVDGVFHGFHGEASISPWKATACGRPPRAHATVLHGAGGDAPRAPDRRRPAHRS